MSSKGALCSMLWLLAVILLLAVATIADEDAGATEDEEVPFVQMLPIRRRDLNDAQGLRRRSDDYGLNTLDLKSEEQLFFGGLSEKGQVVLADMALRAPKSRRMIAMEEFDHLTTAQDCHGDDGHMSLTFKSREAYDYALKTWSYINEDFDEEFYLLADHEGCGPDLERQPYRITKVDNDEANLIIHLAAIPVNFEDEFSSYSINFGEALPTKRFAHRLFKRFVMDPAKILSNARSALARTLNAIQEGGGDASESFTFDLNLGEPDEFKNIYLDPLHQPSRIIINCLSCFVRGTFKVNGYLEVDDYQVKDLSMKITSQGFRVKFDIESRLIFVRVKWDELFDMNIVHPQGLPYLSYDLPHFVQIGAFAAYSAQIVPLFIGVANFTAGIDINVPDGAEVALQFPERSYATGFDEASLDTHFNVRQADAICKVVLSTSPKIFWQIDIAKVGQVEAVALFVFPEYGLDISPRIDKSGACEKELGAGTSGISLNGVIDTTINIIIGTKYRDKPLEIADWRVFFNRRPILKKCYAFKEDNFQVGDSPGWLTEGSGDRNELDTSNNVLEGFDTESQVAPTDSSRQRDGAISGTASGALKARSLDTNQTKRTGRRFRAILD